MGNLTTALLVVLCINGLLWMSQISITGINPDANKFYSGQGGIIESRTLTDNQGNTQMDDSKTASDLPSGGTDVEADSGFFIIDIFGKIISWIGNAASYLSGILKAPYNFLKLLDMPIGYTTIIGTIWYLTSLTILVAWIFGRD
jgi:hypothetical protein